MNKQIMERSVIHAGKVFIKEGDENSRAYIIQSGKVRSYKTEDGKQIPLKEFGPNTIIGEANLFEDLIADKSYEAVGDVTVISLTRHDFQKRLQKADSTIQTLFKHMISKIEELKKEIEQDRLDALDVDETAYQLVRGMVKGVSEDRKREYELAILPHINGLMKSMHKLKAKS